MRLRLPTCPLAHLPTSSPSQVPLTFISTCAPHAPRHCRTCKRVSRYPRFIPHTRVRRRHSHHVTVALTRAMPSKGALNQLFSAGLITRMAKAWCSSQLLPTYVEAVAVNGGDGMGIRMRCRPLGHSMLPQSHAQFSTACSCTASGTLLFIVHCCLFTRLLLLLLLLLQLSALPPRTYAQSPN